MSDKYADLLGILKKEVVLATGCTEPIAVAYAAAIAGNKINDLAEIERVDVWVDAAVYKNGLGVGIPGIKERGLQIATALGLVIARPEKELCILETITPDEEQEAKALVKKGKVCIYIKSNCSRLFIEILVCLKDGSMIKVVVMNKHKNIIKVEEGYGLVNEDLISIAKEQKTNKIIQKYNLRELLDFCDQVSLDDISFLQEGIDRNMMLAEEGLTISKGIGGAYTKMIEEGVINNHMVTRAEVLCSAASEARMTGSRLPAMSSAGSGNHGITIFLTIAGAAEKSGVSKENLLRALAFGNLVTMYIKSFTGTLSAMCGCGVAAGTGASAGIVYMMGGTEEQIFKGMLNMVGSITGLICDGGKEGCAYKLALSAGWAVKAALLALKDVYVHENNGILSSDFGELFENLGYLCNPGMADTNNSILEIMEKHIE